MNRKLSCVSLALLLVLGSSCVLHDTATSMSELPSQNGKPVVHVNTTSIALHLLFTQPLVGNAQFDNTVKEMTTHLVASGAKNVRIVQSNSSSYWYLFFPFTLIITPVVTNVAADGELK